MPLIEHDIFPQIKHIAVLLWQVTETENDLLGLCAGKGIDTTGVCRVSLAKRRIELLVERLLLISLCNKDMELQHTGSGAPFVAGFGQSVSISHSGGYVALAAGSADIGVDIETKASKTLKVRARFLNSQEQSAVALNDVAAHVRAWTAKEAIYKAEGKGTLNCLDGIRLDAEAIACGQNTYMATTSDNKYMLHTYQTKNYTITLATKIK